MRSGPDADATSAFINRAADILFLQNPLGTAFGIVFGVMLSGFAPRFAPFLSGLNLIVWIAAGVCLFNITAPFRSQRLDPTIEAALAAIRLAEKKGELSPEESRIMFRKLFEHVLTQVTLKREARETIGRVDE